MSPSEMRETAVRLMKSRRKKNTYTNGEDRAYFFGKPDNRPGDTEQRGYSDCSSAVRAAIRAACGADIGGNTDAQLRNRARGQIVHETDTGMPDESLLLPGDCLYFKGNPYHLMEVGHVEMYAGPGELYGHGGGLGPAPHSLEAYCRGRRDAGKPYFMTIRWITGAPAAGSERPMLRRGACGESVRLLQRLLIGQQISCGRWGADGEFGPATESALRLFQQRRGLAADGVAGPITWAALEAAEREDAASPADAQPMCAVAHGTWTVRTGPSADCLPLGYVRSGERLPLTGESTPAWLGVRYAGENAWISRKGVPA